MRYALWALYSGIGAGSVIGWIAQSDDIFIFSDGKAFDLVKFRIF